MNKITLTLIALAVSSIVHAETTTITTLDVKGEIQIYGNKVIDSQGTTATANSDIIDLEAYDIDDTRINSYQYFEGYKDGQYYTMTFGYDEYDKFTSEVNTIDGKETWKGEWYNRTASGFTSKMTSTSGDSYFKSECITVSDYTTEVSSWPSMTKLGEKLSSVERLAFDRTRTCTETDLMSDAEPAVNIEEYTDQELLEVTHRTVLLKTSYDQNGYVSDDCIVVLRETMWGEQVRTYCRDLGLVELKMRNNGLLYQRVNALSSPNLEGKQ
ncbi:hypothetical protein CW745_06905 [Psychromonas sp. psych-6C06]|uniref:hypothetical protein n=1 Tax=Psychromonas sp. psych-6C06 TaxID=2058089 RepID=UPI000C329685|nr:hypothetical protein [Psychromonas sp. psych-6C06]PKF63140.1 hypothetical protein CW745_06905 [Psychromonas sp. psych-6C06]